MANYIDDRVRDYGLIAAGTSANVLFIVATTQVTTPATYAQAATAANQCGVKSSPSCTYNTDGPVDGRKIGVASISDGTINNTTVAKWWALGCTTTSRLFAAGSLSATQAVTSGNTFTLDAINISIRDAS